MRETLKLLADRNLRGTTTTELVFEMQGLMARLESTEEISDDSHRYFLECLLDVCLRELLRRRQINKVGGRLDQYPDRELIHAIKDRVKIEDVIGWYTRIFVSSKQNWQYHCTLHGTDRHPSGMLYRDEQRYWCFGCNQGGDIFDAVVAFEETTLQQAIRKLASHIGLETCRKIPARPQYD
tara:strand:- start:4305 stop:4847 length:543 start_codon:yes stop_codon:yes gene_type:complete